MAARAPFPLGALALLAAAIFVCVTCEFLPTGLVPEMAAELGVSESRIGLLVTAFAATVAVSTTPLAIATRALPRKPLMVGLLVVFAASALLAAIAPSYELVVVARVLGGLAHGLFWAVTGPYASHLVDPAQLARALAITGAGVTLAFILGVPVVSAIGHALTWRWAFAAVALAVLVVAAVIAVVLPPVQHLVEGGARGSARRDPTIGAVVVVCVAVVFVMAGHSILYTFIAPWLLGAGIAPEAVPALLLAFGVAGAVGLALAGVLGDRFPRATICTLVLALALSVLALRAAVDSPALLAVCVVLWGVSFGGIPSMFYARNLQVASPAIRDLAAAWITTAFNIAIGGGALVGSLLLDRHGLDSLPVALVAVVSVGLVFVVATSARASVSRQAAPGSS